MRIGIIGGTFNPIHLGHVRLVEEAMNRLSLDKLVLIPAYIPPHKSSNDIISFDDRYKMAEMALRAIPNTEISDIEMKRKGTSYSVETVKELRGIYGASAEIFFIAGSDYAAELESWKDIVRLKRLCRFMIATRPGFEAAAIPEGTERIEVNTPNISSSDIRRMIREGRPFKELLPQDVYEYIVKKKLYGYTS